MTSLKHTVLKTGALLLSLAVFIVTLPFVLLLTATLFVSGIVGAALLSHKMKRAEFHRDQPDSRIIEGSYTVK